jgi:hypothetical protein
MCARVFIEVKINSIFIIERYRFRAHHNGQIFDAFCPDR